MWISWDTGVELADISEEKATEMISLLKERNEDVKKEQKIAAKPASKPAAKKPAAKKSPAKREEVEIEKKAVAPEDELATPDDLVMADDA